MSTAVLEPVVEKTIHRQPVNIAAAAESAEKEFADPHPLLPVFMAGVIALMLAGAFVGSIVVWLMLRNSGVMAQ